MSSTLAFPSQRVAYPYFVVALLLFVLQVAMGLWLAFNYFATVPQGLVDAFPFATARAFHTNLLVLWLLLGFMGATYYLVPEEAQREIASRAAAWVQLVLLVGAGVAGLVGFVFGWTQGRPLLELPRPLDVVIVLAALIFLGNVGWTLWRGRRWTLVQGSLLAGLVFLALLYLVGMPFYRNIAVDWYYWWWVIHLWVEGSWELIAAAITAFLLIKMTGVERRVVEKWLYVELGLFLFTGIVGTGHHYYWLGTPTYWLWMGGIFSALEPFPILLMVIDTFRYMRERKVELKPRLTWVYLLGGVILHLLGAGLFGFAHTLPQVNYWTHGSQVTVAHGHLAFYGAYVLLVLTFVYFAMPKLRAIEDDDYASAAGHWGFWMTSLGVVGMSLSFAVAGVLQTYLERIGGQPYMKAAEPIRFWMLMAFIHGVVVLAGVLVTVLHLLRLHARQQIALRAPQRARQVEALAAR